MRDNITYLRDIRYKKPFMREITHMGDNTFLRDKKHI